jgi:hypothetical protein
MIFEITLFEGIFGCWTILNTIMGCNTCIRHGDELQTLRRAQGEHDSDLRRKELVIGDMKREMWKMAQEMAKSKEEESSEKKLS